MQIDIYTIVKYGIIYALFILGISILSEWIDTKLKTCSYMESSDKQYALILDSTLDQLKEQIKTDYMNRFKKIHNQNGYLHQKIPEDPVEGEEEYFTNYNNMITKEEKMMMNEVDKKLKSQNFLEMYPHTSFGRIPLHESYKKLPREVKWEEPVKTVIPKKKSYKVGDKYTFFPGQKDNMYQADDEYLFPGKNFNIKPLDKKDIFYSVL